MIYHFLFFINILVDIGAYELCDTPSCRDIVESINLGMNSSVNPCDDFHGFICGKWNANNPIPFNNFKIDLDIKLKLKAQQRIKDILTKPVRTYSPRVLRTAKSLYSMCTDIVALQDRGAYPLLGQLYKTGFPLLYRLNDPKYANINSWQSYHLNTFDILEPKAFYTLTVETDLITPTKYITTLGDPSIILSREFKRGGPSDETNYNYNEQYIYLVVQYLNKAENISINENELRNEIDKLLNFDIELASFTSPPEDAYDAFKIYNVMTIKEFQKLYDDNGGSHPAAKIDWLEVLRLEYGDSGYVINDSEKIAIKNPDFYKKLPGLLTKTPARTTANYVVWSLIRTLLRYTDFEKPIIQDEKNIECLDHPNLSKAISYEYIHRYFNSETRRKAVNMISEIKIQIYTLISRTQWMDIETKIKCIEKVQATLMQIGNPYNTADDIDNYYTYYELGSNYLDSVIKLLKINSRKERLNLRQLFDRMKWPLEPTAVVAGHVDASNSIIIPAAYLESPLYDIDRPDALNYPVIGFLAAHELSHGFDTNGRLYDKTGSAVTWWSQEIIDHYNIQAKCFIDQYNAYQFLSPNNDLLSINGNLTSIENIADQIGLQAAFAAFKNEQTKSGKEVRVKGLEKYTSEQLFFMQYGNWLCENVKPHMVEYLAKTDPHPPGILRIRGTIENNADFATVFNCPDGSPMISTKKCSIFGN
ncbi:neprilysin-11-like [Prorops nasuta]|uniref:neprilysin-11-like n=1 Tax=Prorops nasuta TaxID=863751 RepID=UPI0034CDC608